MEDMQEFTAYLRRLARDLDDIHKALEHGDIAKALELVEQLQEDTSKDIEK